MDSLFKALGVMLAFYTLYAAVTGEVYAKSGASGRSISKAEAPTYFWVIIAIYGALSVALLTVF